VIEQNTPESEPQAASAVFMVRPTAFASNPETRASNAFQRGVAAAIDLNARAQAEFGAVVAALRAAGVRVHVFDGRLERDCPDEIFPNNWVSFHTDGTVVLYPMLAPNRRRERRPELLDALVSEHGCRISRTLDLTTLEARGRFLEGTGSLVLDRIAHVAYVCRSPRSDQNALANFGAALGYETVVFDALDADGQPVYHTNVVMAVGTRFAVVCFDAMPNAADRSRVATRLAQSGRTVITIDLDQLSNFAANLLELSGRDGPVIALSARALASLSAEQRRALESFGALVAVAIPTIETVGGGSVRCMLAEIFLPQRKTLPRLETQV